MTRRTAMAGFSPSASLAILMALAATGCTEHFKGKRALNTFSVTFSDAQTAVGSAEAPLPFISGKPCGLDTQCQNGERCRDGNCSRCYSVDVQAIDTRGEAFPYDGPVHFTVAPGVPTTSTEHAEMTGGVLNNQEVCFNRALGKTHIWVEQDGIRPRPDELKYGQCNDGIDNDNNNLVDLADPGCDSAMDNLEAPVGYATGVAPAFFFDTPSIPQIQRTAFVRTSPMRGLQVRVDRGAMVVTNVVGNGFYVTDMDAAQEPAAPFASVFVFTFSVPKDVMLGDIVCWFSGAVEEHVGQTQIIFPSFQTARADGSNLNPETCGRDISALLGAYPPVKPGGGIDLTDRLVAETGPFDSANIQLNSELLEPYESSLIRVRNIAVPTRFISCDRDGNGSIAGGDEQDCRNACQNEDGCSDLESLFEYRQWNGIVDHKKKMAFSVAIASDFVPLAIDFMGQDDQTGACERHLTPLGFLEYTCQPRTIAATTGSLRHIYLCGQSGGNDCGLQFWVLDPRFDPDVELDGGTR